MRLDRRKQAFERLAEHDGAKKQVPYLETNLFYLVLVSFPFAGSIGRFFLQGSTWPTQSYNNRVYCATR